ncbi:MAG: hypothetical protein QNJ35_06790 [Paracoccaceae bacterium]|nr:hypothetical protein [Paracoccaceae bacterium]
MKRTTLTAALAILLPAAASAQQTCAPREAVLERLSERFGESRQSIGLAAQNRIVEVHASEATGTWTITVTMPNGITCLVAAGRAYETVGEAARPSGIPS